MKIAILTTDSREHFRDYGNPVPYFGAAPEALLQGFAEIGGAEIHVISCAQQPMVSSPEKLANNIIFHSLHVPKIGWLRTASSRLCPRDKKENCAKSAPTSTTASERKGTARWARFFPASQTS